MQGKSLIQSLCFVYIFVYLYVYFYIIVSYFVYVVYTTGQQQQRKILIQSPPRPSRTHALGWHQYWWQWWWWRWRWWCWHSQTHAFSFHVKWILPPVSMHCNGDSKTSIEYFCWIPWSPLDQGLKHNMWKYPLRPCPSKIPFYGHH